MKTATKEKTRRLICSILAFAMTLSLFSVPGFSEAAQAAGSESSSSTPVQAKSGEEEKFRSVAGDSGKPMLYIDFLGDNTTGGAYGAGVSVPTTTDRSAAQSGTADPAGTWGKYTSSFPNRTDNGTGYLADDTDNYTVFWVGVGIDKMKLFELAKKEGETGKGLSSLELGFYYNPAFVEPYTGGDYKTLLTNFNLAPGAPVDSVNKWNSYLYHIQEALTDLDPVVDADTQEPMRLTVQPEDETAYTEDFDPVGGGWRMLYVSLERTLNEAGTDWVAGANRFSDPDSLNDGIYYVMMLPFVLKSYDAQRKLCFRLARNASAFSMGGGKYGAGSYDADNVVSSFGAWEADTRTPNHNLKEMFDFEGDLNIFTGENESDQFYTASLEIVNWADNSAVLYPTDDPSKYVNTGDGSVGPHGVISKLVSGTEMTLEATKNELSTTVIVNVTNLSTNTSVSTLVDVVPDSSDDFPSKYTFVMPSANVRVKVIFKTSDTPLDNYTVELNVVDAANQQLNFTTVSGKNSTQSESDPPNTATATSQTPAATPGVGRIIVAPDNTVTVDVTCHPDYYAEVTAETFSGNPVNMVHPTGPKAAEGVTADDALNTYCRVYSHTFVMPTSDTRVTVTYHKYNSFDATLQVDTNVGGGSADNIARLSYVDYSGVETEDDLSDPAKAVTRAVQLNGSTGSNATLEDVPETRRLTLDIALHPLYTVTQITLYDLSGTGTTLSSKSLLPLLTAKEPAEGTFTRTLHFDMPANAVQVYVRFERKANYTAKLILDEATMGTGKLSGKYDGDDSDPDATYNETNMLGEGDAYKDEILIQSGNVGTVKIKPDEGYKVKDVKITTSNILIPQISYTGDYNDYDASGESTIQFVMPAAKVTVTVTFEEIEKETHRITLRPVPDDDVNAYEQPKSGWPRDPDDEDSLLDWPTLTEVVVGTTKTAWMQIRPYWYISSVKVVGDETGTGYPLLSIDGNGYNNGEGGKVTLQVNQPPEDTTVYIYLKDSRVEPPPEEPNQGVTLLVSDPDNTDTDDPANNWAKMSVNGSSPARPDPDGVKKDGSYTDDTVIAGDVVTVTWNADDGYYVSDVTVAPESWGVVPNWLVDGGGKPYIQFTEPAGPVTVIVKFAKIDDTDPPIKATLHVTGATGDESGKLTNTTTTTSVTVEGPDWDPASVGAWPGQVFATGATTTGRYVLVEVYKGGSLVSWTATGGEGNGTFVMPAGDVDVYMTFRDDPIDVNDRRITLTAYGPAVAGDPGGSGSAELFINGTAASASAGPDGPVAKSNQTPVPTVRDFAKAGDTIKIVATPKDGYVVDRIIYTPNGAVSPVELSAPVAGGRAVEFTMPDHAEAVEVYFRKGEPTKYMANIILWPPAGMALSDIGDVGDGRFTANNAYSIAAAAGTDLTVKAKAYDGYYISRVEITPAALGIPGPITGSFATQTLDFVMPAANCVVNIYYEKGWPDGYHANLIVHDADHVAGNKAILKDTTKGTQLSDYVAADTTGVGRGTLAPVAPMDVMTVEIQTADDYKVDLPISITDPYGTEVPYWWSGEGEISFYMPGNWVNVDVTYVKKADGEEPYSGLIAKIHDSEGTTSMTHGATVTGDGASFTDLHTGDEVQVKVAPPTNKLPVIQVKRTDGTVIPIPVPQKQDDGSYTTSFAMPERIGDTVPDEDAGVYITYVDAPGEDSKAYLDTLIVTQDGGTSASTAELYEKVTVGNTTGAVSVGSTGGVNIDPGKTVVIKTTPDTGYLVKSIVVTDQAGNLLNVVQTGPDTYEYVTPMEVGEGDVVTGSPVTAVVTFREKKTAEEDEPDPEKYTAQVVVNNDGDEDNKVVLRKTPTGTPGAMLTDLAPSDQVIVDITVAAGSKITLILVSPTMGGAFQITELSALETQSQQVSFYMPADDVIVYVQFESDGIDRYTITMEVFDETEPESSIVINGTDNVATLHSDISGTTDPASKHGDPLVWVKGAPGEVVTIVTKPRAGYYPVVTAVYEGTTTPISNLTVSEDQTTFTFSVPSSDVTTEVHFWPNATKPKHNVTLHIILPDGATVSDVVDLDNTFVTDVNATIPTTINGDGEVLMDVPYLDSVAVKATARSGYYLQGAYAMFGGVILPDLSTPTPTRTSASRSFDFRMQNGNVDVYMIFTDTEPQGAYNVGLTVRGPAGITDPIVGRAGSAVLKNLNNGKTTVSAGSDKEYVPATDSVTADQEDIFTVRIKLNPGYEIDTVVVTPFYPSTAYPYPSTVLPAIVPDSITYDNDAGEWVYRYQYPSSVARDLMVTVTLKEEEIDAYTVTLYLDDEYRETNTVEPADYINKADVNYTTVHLTEDQEHMDVPEEQLVSVEVTAGVEEVADGDDVYYYVHHAYAVAKGNESKKSGRVLPLYKLKEDETLDEDTIVSLQNVGFTNTGSDPVSDKAWFEMPDEPVDVYIDFRDREAKPPVGDYSAVITVHEVDEPYQATSRVRMEELARHTKITRMVDDTEVEGAPSDGKTYGPLSVNKDEWIILNWYGLIAPSFKVKRITVTGGATDVVFEPGEGVTEYKYKMPAHDVGFIVELEPTDPPEYKATLHIEDHSSAMGNTVSMWEYGYPTPVVTTDLGELTGLAGTSIVRTKPVAADGVVVTVMATDATGTHFLTGDPDSGEYSYTLDYHDVDITVVFENDIEDRMYIATVEKTGATYLSNNTAAVTNTSNPALPKGNIWTGVYAGHSLQVDVTTELGYYAVITARLASELAGTASIPVLQLGVTGTVVGYLDVPADLSENVIITVDYSNVKPPQVKPYDLILEQVDPDNADGNKAKTTYVDSNEDGQALEVAGNATADTTDKTNDKKPMGGDPIDLTTETAVGYIQRITLTSGGLTVDLPVADGSFFMPLGDATVTVTRRNTTRTARPHDWNQHPTDVGGYVDGYLKARNLGGNKALIQVPNLYEAASDTTSAANNDNVTYKLYIRTGGTYTALVEGVDYDIISFGPYTYPETDIVNSPKLPGDDKGWQYTIRSLKGESALTDIIRNGGVLYITATEGSNDESQKVEVVLPADPNAGTYWAKLVIVDTSGKTGNSAKMSDGVTTVVNSGTITGLNGDELIRTLVTDTATGAPCIAVTVTDSAGTILLTENPAGTERYPYYMTGENITVTVYFASVEDPSLTRYIASVTKRGAYDVAGNGATIKNATRSDLLKGSIWAQGHPDNTMRVDVTVAKGYYATLKAKRLSDGAEVLVTAFGAGPGTGTGTDEDSWTAFYAILQMPADDVQVEVTYTKDPPDNLKSELILKLVDHGDLAANTATLKEKVESGAIELTAFGSATAYDTKKSTLDFDPATKVAAGTQFKLTTGSATTETPPYYVKKVLLKVYAEDADVDDPGVEPILTMTLPLASDKTVDPITMPLGRTVVEVVYSNDPRTARPYDLKHSSDYNDYNDPDYEAGSTNPDDLSDPTQLGWIEAREMTADDDGKSRVGVTIPALHDDESTDDDKWTALSHAGVTTPTPGPAATYKFYWRDDYGVYHPLTTSGTAPDLTVTFVAATKVNYPVTVDETTTDHELVNYQFILTANQSGGLMEYYIKKGGTIYVTATQDPTEESDYTQIVIPKLYTATLWYTPTPVGTPTVSPGGTAKMSVPDKNPVTGHGDIIAGLKGNESVTVSDITPSATDPEYELVGVVATTETGSVNATKDGSKYKYQMADESVDVRVVFNRKDDPLKEKGPHIVTVFKEGHDDLVLNHAEVKDLDVTIPDEQRDTVNGSWTVAYSGNVVRVDFTTETGYVVDTITAEKTNGDTGSVPVLRYGTYAIFYMPDGCDVNVTVTYATGDAMEHALKLAVNDADAEPGNTADVTYTGGSLHASGDAPNDGPNDVAADTALELTTDVADNYYVSASEMEVDGFPYKIPIPLIDGVSVPEALMPYADAEIQVTYQSGVQSPRPYEPDHSVAYNAYDVTDNPTGYDPAVNDLSTTHQEGWIKAATKGADKFDIPVRTLHDMKGDGGTDQLYHAWYTGGFPTYRLYWKDEAGVFHLLTQGEGGDITVTRTRINQDVEEDDPYVKGDDKYDGYVLSVTVNVDDDGNAKNLWGGYKLLQYLKNGGSIFVTSTRNGEVESEKTEVVLTARTYTATLRWKPIGTGAEMSIPGHGSVTEHNAKITELNGTEVVTVSDIDDPVNVTDGEETIVYRPVGVVAITESGTVNAIKGGSDANPEYTYTMANEDVIMQVVYKRDDDPIDEKKPLHIVTVYKVGHDDEPDNAARVKDLDVEIPAYQRDTANGAWPTWTAAYEGNVVRVDVGVKTGYYALITAVQKDGEDPETPVPVAQFATFNDDGVFTGCYGLLYMPKDYDVDVTVTYIKIDDDLPTYKLTLKVVEDPALPVGSTLSNAATIVDKLDPDTPTLTMNAVTGMDAGPVDVKAGTDLNLSTTPNIGWSVKKVTMDLLDDDDTVLLTIDVPVIDGKSVPVPTMPFSKAVITVTFWEKAQLARPYDPAHAEMYNEWTEPDYNAATDDKSSTGMDGWILASATADDTFTITVPALFDHTATVTTDVRDKLSGAANTLSGYKLYWKDEMGNFQEITVGTGNDVTLTTEGGTDPVWGTLNSYTLTVKVNKTGSDPEMPTLWGGYKLLEYLENGGSVYISHVDGVYESEKTEVVIFVDKSGLRPYDPERFYPDGTADADKKYDTPGANWIRAENRGDYAVITVPTLYDNAKSAKEDVQWTVVEEDEEADAWVHDAFLFYLAEEKDGETVYIDLLDKGVIVLSHPDPDHDPVEDPRPYEMGNYYTDDKGTEDTDDDVAYTGARFLLTPTKTRAQFEAITDADQADFKRWGLAVWDILDNFGTKSGTTDHDFSLYISVKRSQFDPEEDTEPSAKEGPKVDLEVPQYLKLVGNLESYAPTHTATFSLYPLIPIRDQDDAETDDEYAAFKEKYPTEVTSYADEATLVFTDARKRGSGLWSLPFALKSSELMGKDGKGLTYRFTIEKAGHVTFTWLALELSPDTLDDNPGADGLTFTIAAFDEENNVLTDDDGAPIPGTIALFGGDVDGDNFVRMDDYFLHMGYFGAGLEWSKTTNKASPNWAISTYNKDSLAYVADLTGDGRISAEDTAIWNIDRNRGKGPEDYPAQYLYRIGLTLTDLALTPLQDLSTLSAQELLALYREEKINAYEFINALLTQMEDGGEEEELAAEPATAETMDDSAEPEPAAEISAPAEETENEAVESVTEAAEDTSDAAVTDEPSETEEETDAAPAEDEIETASDDTATVPEDVDEADAAEAPADQAAESAVEDDSDDAATEEDQIEDADAILRARVLAVLVSLDLTEDELEELKAALDELLPEPVPAEPELPAASVPVEQPVPTAEDLAELLSREDLTLEELNALLEREDLDEDDRAAIQARIDAFEDQAPVLPAAGIETAPGTTTEVPVEETGQPADPQNEQPGEGVPENDASQIPDAVSAEEENSLDPEPDDPDADDPTAQAAEIGADPADTEDENDAADRTMPGGDDSETIIEDPTDSTTDVPQSDSVTDEEQNGETMNNEDINGDAPAADAPEESDDTDAEAPVDYSEPEFPAAQEEEELSASEGEIGLVDDNAITETESVGNQKVPLASYVNLWYNNQNHGVVYTLAGMAERSI